MTALRAYVCARGTFHHRRRPCRGARCGSRSSGVGGLAIDLFRRSGICGASETSTAEHVPTPRVGCFSEQKNGGPWEPPRLQKLGLIYALLRRRRPSQPKPIRAEPMSVSDAGSGAVTVGTKFVVSCSGFPFADS